MHAWEWGVGSGGELISHQSVSLMLGGRPHKQGSQMHPGAWWVGWLEGCFGDYFYPFLLGGLVSV